MYNKNFASLQPLKYSFRPGSQHFSVQKPLSSLFPSRRSSTRLDFTNRLFFKTNKFVYFSIAIAINALSTYWEALITSAARSKYLAIIIYHTDVKCSRVRRSASSKR